MHKRLLSRLPAGAVLTGLLVLLLAAPASAQWRMTTEAVVGLGHIPFVVRDLDAASTAWRDLGFTVKPGSTQDNGLSNNHVKFEDSAGIELIAVPAAVDDVTTKYWALLDEAEGPVAFAFHSHDMGAVSNALDNRTFEYGPVSHAIAARGLEFLSVVQDNRAPDDAAYIKHPNGAKALSRVWIALPRTAARKLRDMLGALGGDLTNAKVYAPEAVQSYDITISNGEVLILPPSSQLTSDRPIIGATFEVEDIDVVSKRLDLFGVPWILGGTENLSVIVAPDATRGMWVEFRE